MNNPEETALFEKIKKSDESAFEILFHLYYGHLCLFATQIINDDVAAEEIVQDFFVKLWEKKSQITIETSVKNYLFRSVKNLCLNFIQHNKIKTQHANDIRIEHNLNYKSGVDYPEIDLTNKIEESIQSLPEKRQEIFRLSREEGLKYREIAEKLKISIKTVETQMGLAIKTLREKLKDYNTLFILFCAFIKK